tara:strand:- start:346 stop:495 length:150 start_codon:yes stop_codon:yes gene_type:complete
MEDKTPLIGFAGAIGSISLGQLDEIVGLTAGALTCLYLLVKLFKLLKSK